MFQFAKVMVSRDMSGELLQRIRKASCSARVADLVAVWNHSSIKDAQGNLWSEVWPEKTGFAPWRLFGVIEWHRWVRLRK